MTSDETDPDRHDDDLALAAAVLVGDEPAILQFSDRLTCVPRILSAQNAKLGRPLDVHDLADLAQDAVVIILEKLGSYEGRAPLEGWIYRVCSLEFMNTLRRKRRGPRPMLDAEEESLEAESTGSQASLAQREQVGRALAKIGGAEAETISLKHFEGLTFEEMSIRLKTAVSTLKTRYYRGMTKLESILTAEEGSA